MRMFEDEIEILKLLSFSMPPRRLCSQCRPVGCAHSSDSGSASGTSSSVLSSHLLMAEAHNYELSNASCRCVGCRRWIFQFQTKTNNIYPLPPAKRISEWIDPELFPPSDGLTDMNYEGIGVEQFNQTRESF